MASKLEAQKEEGVTFLKSNRDKEGVVELPNGMQYMELKKGMGASPMVSDIVKAHYRGALLDGKEFDNSFMRGQPFTAPLGSLIKGWQEALPLMQEGSLWRLWIPSELAYGDRGAGQDIPGGATLMFDVELLQVIKK